MEGALDVGYLHSGEMHWELGNLPRAMPCADAVPGCPLDLINTSSQAQSLATASTSVDARLQLMQVECREPDSRPLSAVKNVNNRPDPIDDGTHCIPALRNRLAPNIPS